MDDKILEAIITVISELDKKVDEITKKINRLTKTLQLLVNREYSLEMSLTYDDLDDEIEDEESNLEEALEETINKIQEFQNERTELFGERARLNSARRTLTKMANIND